jgi:competence protein ComEC
MVSICSTIQIALLGFAAGIIYLQQQPVLPGLTAVFSWSGALALAVWLLSRAQASVPDCNRFELFGRRVWVLRWSAIFLLMASLGVAWASWRAQIYLQDRLSATAEQAKSHLLHGSIISLPRALSPGFSGAGGWRFVFAPDPCASADCARYPSRILLAWYGAPETLQIGQRWQLTVALKRPHGLLNPGGSDDERWLYQQGVGATGSVRAGVYLAEEISLRARLGRWRAKLLTSIQAGLPADFAHRGVIQALAVGEQQAVTPEDWQRFRISGTSHLLAISGLHITLVASLVGGLSAWCWRRPSTWVLRIPARVVGMLTGLLAAGLYGLLSGMHIPAQRALIMLTVLVLAYVSGRIVAPSVILCWALFFVLLYDPMAVLSPGFWLSFIAVASILLALRRNAVPVDGPRDKPGKWRKIGQKIQAAVQVQLAVSVTLMPLTAMFFGQLTLLSLVANAVLIPIFSIFVVPLSLLGVLFPDPLAVSLLAWAHQWVAWSSIFLDWLGTWPFSLWDVAAPSMLALTSAALGALWFICSRRWRALGLVLLWPLFWRPSNSIAPGEFYAAVLDVGQGGAVFIQTAKHALLFDSGPDYFGATNAAQRVILPYLRARGITSLDSLMISHQDRDHSGGMHTLLRELPVQSLISSISAEHPLLQEKYLRFVPHRPCHQGQSWQWDGVLFEIIHPLKNASGKANALSCTLRVATAQHALLLPGDIGHAQELEILSRTPASAIQASVLLMPHHGSLTSSSTDWLDAVRPQLAVAQVGYRNRFKHPRTEVVARYVARGIQVLRSDGHGAIELHTQGSQLIWTSFRLQEKRYWHSVLAENRKND